MPKDMKEKLEGMYVEQSISLQAAEARKRMATELRKQADTYIDLMQALPRITKEKEQLSAMLPDWAKRLEEARRELSVLMQERPRIIDNTVYIYRVAGANAPAGN